MDKIYDSVVMLKKVFAWNKSVGQFFQNMKIMGHFQTIVIYFKILLTKNSM